MKLTDFISQKLVVMSFCKSQFPHKSVNFFSTITNIQNALTNLCGDSLLQNHFMNTFCELKTGSLIYHPKTLHEASQELEVEGVSFRFSGARPRV